MAQIETYGKVDKALHWLVVLNLGATLVFSKGMSDLTAAERAVAYSDHGLSVTTLFLVMSFRLVWRIRHGFPPLPDSMSTFQQMAAKLVHKAIYVLIFAQIAVGFLLASAVDVDMVPKFYGVNYTAFGLVGPEMNETLLGVHKVIYWSIVAVIGLHVAAALKHAVIDRDGVLRRMLPFTGS